MWLNIDRVLKGVIVHVPKGKVTGPSRVEIMFLSEDAREAVASHEYCYPEWHWTERDAVSLFRDMKIVLSQKILFIYQMLVVKSYLLNPIYALYILQCLY